jgi:hypothetical protein
LSFIFAPSHLVLLGAANKKLPSTEPSDGGS